MDQGDLKKAGLLFESALAIWEKTLGHDDPDTVRSLSNLAYLLEAQGNVADAWQLHERALAIRQKMLGPEHSDTVDSLLVLAMRPAMAEDFSRARPLYERALALTQQVLGPEAPGTNRVRSNLSRILLSAGEPTEAVGLSAAALAAHDNVLGR